MASLAEPKFFRVGLFFTRLSNSLSEPELCAVCFSSAPTMDFKSLPCEISCERVASSLGVADLTTSARALFVLVKMISSCLFIEKFIMLKYSANRKSFLCIMPLKINNEN